MVVNISLKPQDGDDPQLIFESLNSTGQALDESDKIRNYVLMGLNSKEQERIYRNYWEKLENIVGKSETSKFIRHYLAVKCRDLPKEDKLYFEFKKYNLNSKNTIEEILSDMLIYAKYYNSIKNCNPYSHGYEGSFGRLMKLDVNTAIPLMFDLYYAKQNNLIDENEFKEAAQIIEAYYVRRMICGLPAASLNRTFVSIGNEVDKYMKTDDVKFIDAFKYSVLIRSGKSRFPNELDFEEAFKSFELYNAKPSLRKYILERLENFDSKERIAVEEQIDKGELTIEHVMPQTLTSEWKKSLGINWELIHTKYKDTIGNLTLTAYNSDYSNLIFKKKKEMENKGFIYSKLSLNEYIKSVEDWNEETILFRADLLWNKAKNIWPLPETTYSFKEEEEWVELDDEYDFTNKTIKKIIFMGDELSTDNISDAYNKVNSLLYILDPNTYSSNISKYHSSNKLALRKPYEIADSMYIETNMSSQSKINELRELFKVFSLDTQELRFLVSLKSNKVFNLNDVTTFDFLKVGSLAYELVNELLSNNYLSNDEIELLMTKEYCKDKFNKLVYPVLAISHDSHKGNSENYRYYKKPVIVNNRKFYVTSQWYEDNREQLISWYKMHKNII